MQLFRRIFQRLARLLGNRPAGAAARNVKRPQPPRPEPQRMYWNI